MLFGWSLLAQKPELLRIYWRDHYYMYRTYVKNVKIVKGCRDGMQKVCKQGRDDIIIYKALSLHLFTLHTAKTA